MIIWFIQPGGVYEDIDHRRSGACGVACAEHFSRARHKVVVLDKPVALQDFFLEKKSVEYNWKFLSGLKNVTLVKGDIRNFEALKKTFSKFVPDVVIHTASQPGVRASLENPHMDF